MKLMLATVAATAAALVAAAPASAQVYNTQVGPLTGITVPPSFTFSNGVNVTTAGATTLNYIFSLNSAMTLNASSFTSASGNPFTFSNVSLVNTGTSTTLTSSSSVMNSAFGSSIGLAPFVLNAGSYRITVTGNSTVTTGNSASVGSSITFGAVPEAGTWAMMIAGFGLVGGAMRRRSTKVAFA